MVPRGSRLEPLHGPAADEDLFLAEAVLERLAIPSPPGAVEAGDEDFEEQVGVAFDSPLRFLPQAGRRAAGVGGDAAELIGQFTADGGESGLGDGAVLAVVERQE
jgi:hypothetical protein